MQYKVLFVDDEAANLRLLERLFRAQYEVHTASSGEEAIRLLEIHDVALIVSDQRMPAMTGSDFLKVAAEMRPQTVRIMLTGYTDVNDLVDAINAGVVYKYITKPWINEELQQTVKRALQHYETTKAQRQLQLKCERLQSQLAATTDGFVDVILQMVDARLAGCGEHARRTAILAARIAEICEMDRSEWETLTLAARLYDVPAFCAGSGSGHDALDDLERIPALENVAALLRHRHENFDGTGTPIGFSGTQIPIAARVLAAAETYDRLRHPLGAPGLVTSHEEALRLLESEAGTRLDPSVVSAIAVAVRSADQPVSENELALA